MDDLSNLISLDEVTGLQQRSSQCIAGNGGLNLLEFRDWALMIQFCDQHLKTRPNEMFPVGFLRTVHLHTLALQMTATARIPWHDYLEPAIAVLKTLVGGLQCAPHDKMWLYALWAQLEMLRSNAHGATYAAEQAIALAKESNHPFFIANALLTRSFTGIENGRHNALEQAYAALAEHQKAVGGQFQRHEWVLLYYTSSMLTNLYRKHAKWRSRQRRIRSHEQLLGQLEGLGLLGSAHLAKTLPVPPVFYPFPL